MTEKLLRCLLLAALALPAAGRAQVKIGFINSITGPEAPIGENLTHGVDLALGAWNRLQTCPASTELTAQRARTIAIGFIDAFQNTNIAPEASAG